MVPDVRVVRDGLVTDERLGGIRVVTQGGDDERSREDAVLGWSFERFERGIIALLGRLKSSTPGRDVGLGEEGRIGLEVIDELLESNGAIGLSANKGRVGGEKHALLERVAVNVEDFGGRVVLGVHG